MTDLAEFDLPYGFRQSCPHCIIGDPCERHKLDRGSDTPTAAEKAAMDLAAGMADVADSLAAFGGMSRWRYRELYGE